MAQVTITINAREYAVACEDGQEIRIMQLARLLDEKAKLLTQGAGQVNENMLLAMVGLLLADELTELKKQSNSSEVKTVQAPQSMPDLSALDDLLTTQIKKLTNEINSVASKLESL